jgi:hypothetical protein
MVDTRSMPKKPRQIRFQITLTGEDVDRWTRLAESQSITLEKLVRESVELAIMRGSSR